MLNVVRNGVHYPVQNRGRTGEFGLHVDSKDGFHDVEAYEVFSYVFVLFEFGLVDLVRFELTTSSMPWKRAPNCATGPSGVDL
jgi:hypothetical protein